jgi:hypothetical protein
MRILVMGYIIRGPLGDMAWHHLQYVLGLTDLGHDVLFMEDSEDYPACYNPDTFEITANPDYGLRFTESLFRHFGLTNNWCYFDAHQNEWHGLNKQKVYAFCQTADIVINLSGVNPLREWWASIPGRLLVDTDPVFTQVKHLTNPVAMQTAKAHTHFATFGENFGKPGCSIPDDHLLWQPTRQPVYLKAWNKSAENFSANWTTLMQWDSYKNAEYEGKSYRMKSASFEPFLTLPGHFASEKFELALGSLSAPRSLLAREGWMVTDPLKVSKTPTAFREFIASSKGEWTTAKHGYVVTNSGWFSERTLNYMASAKPVVVQDTGLYELFPTGAGVLLFTTLEEAVENIKRVNRDYSFQCQEARKVVEEHFNSKAVLQHLLSSLN